MRKDRKVTWEQVHGCKERQNGLIVIPDIFDKALDAEWARFRAKEELQKKLDAIPAIGIIIEKMIPRIDDEIRRKSAKGKFDASFYLDHLDRNLDDYKPRHSAEDIYKELCKLYKSRGYKMDYSMNQVLGFKIRWD
jgi:hypothetical protein